jgi:multiple antibiotic resistance protein
MRSRFRFSLACRADRPIRQHPSRGPLAADDSGWMPQTTLTPAGEEAGSNIRPLACTVVQWRVFGETLVTLLVIMDPAGTTPIFVALTHGYTSRQSARAAVGAVGAAAGLILGFALFGRVILDYLHVSLESLSIAGGLLLLLVALEMLRGVDMAPPPGHDIALVPLATPLLAGPGAIATVMVLVRRNPGGDARLAVVAGIVGAAVVVGAALLVAGRLARLVPQALLQFVTRVFGLLLSAIAVQLIVDAVRTLVRTT